MATDTETRAHEPAAAEGDERPPRLPPAAYPLLGLLFGGILVWALSRILLVVSAAVAAVIALFVALNILVGAALVAYGPRVRRRPVAFPLLLGAAVLIVGAGVVAASFGDRPPGGLHGGGGGEGGPTRLALVAQNSAFDKTELTFPTGPVVIEFDNRDAVPHNVSVFEGSDATGEKIFGGELITGPATTEYEFEAPAAGGYFFHCDVHPDTMKGTIEVTQEGGSGGDGGGGDGGGGGDAGLSLAAQNSTFDKQELSAPGGGQITIEFVNEDPGIPHNVSVFQGQDATAPVIFRGGLITGPSTERYSFEAPPPGSYFFQCDVHPTTMTGTLTVG